MVQGAPRPGNKRRIKENAMRTLSRIAITVARMTDFKPAN